MLTVPDQSKKVSADADDIVGAGDSMALSLPLSGDSVGEVASQLSAHQFELCYYPTKTLEVSHVLPAYTAADRVMDVVILDTAQHPLSNGRSIPEYSAMLQTTLRALELNLTTALTGIVDPRSSVEHILQLAVNIARGSERPTPSTVQTLNEIRQTNPSVGLTALRNRTVFWSTQSFPRRTDPWIWQSDQRHTEKRTQHNLQLAREVVRGLTVMLDIEYVDVTEDISVPWQDCAADSAHVDWVVVDEVFAALYDVLQQRLGCDCQSTLYI